MPTSHDATALPVKGQDPKPKGFAGTPPPPRGWIPFILALWAYILGLSCHFGFAVRHFAVSSLLGLHFRAFWPCGVFHFLAFWPFGPSFPCILAFLGLHFLSFWPFRGQLLGPPPQVAKNCPFAQRPYNGFISAVTGSILQFLAFWALISLHFGLVGLHFLAFWPCGPSFPCILAFWAFTSFHFGLFGVSFWGSRPTSCQKWPVCPTSLQWIYQRRDRLHFAVFSLLGLHFLAFWPCRPSFPCILALWAFISLHFGLVGLHFLSFWLFGVSFWGSRPTSCQKWPVCPTSLQWIYQRRDRLHFAVFSLLGLHFLAFWPCRPSFPCILALWAFISLHFGLVGLHFLSFWLFGVSFWGPGPQVAKNGPFAQRPYNGFISAVTGSILQFFAV